MCFTLHASRFTRPVIATICLVMASGLPAATEPPIFPLKDVKPGLVGECRTVFSGSKIESFHFRVEGIGWDNVGPGRDTIWCRMLDDPTGAMVVAAGMSGSPCYVDGKLLGGLAYGWTFNKDPVFGIQPIESMLLVEKDFGEPGKIKRRSAQKVAHAQSSVGLPALLAGPAFASLPPRPEFEIPIPVQLGHLDPAVSGEVMNAWRKSGLFPLRAGSGTSRRPFKAEIGPGATAAGVIAKGDFTAAGTGTCTWRDGDRVLCFGHPFFGRGRIEMPLAESEIIGIVSSYERSFKMANLGEIVGTLTQDRLTAVGGKIGPKPAMIPMTVKVRYPKDTREYKLEFINDELFAPLVYQSALAEFFGQVIERSEEATIRMTGKINVKGFPPVQIERLTSGVEFSWLLQLLSDSGQEIAALYRTDLHDFQVESVEIEAEIKPVYEPLIIEEVEAYPAEVKPGGTVSGWVTMRRYREERQTVPFKMKIPEEVKSGEVEIRVMDSEAADEAEGRWLGFSTEKPSTPEGLINVLNDRHDPGKLYFYLAQKSPGAIVRTERLPGLPVSVRQQLLDNPSGREAKSIQEAFLSKEVKKMDGRVEGSAKIKIKIK